MGVKSILRHTSECSRVALADKLLTKYWQQLTVKQVNFLTKYTAMYSGA